MTGYGNEGMPEYSYSSGALKGAAAGGLSGGATGALIGAGAGMIQAIMAAEQAKKERAAREEAQRKATIVNIYDQKADRETQALQSAMSAYGKALL